MTKASVSVILTSYNYGHCIGEALEAILSQAEHLLEVTVVDDASTDNSVEVIEEFARRYPILHLLRNERNLGVERTVLRALECVSGDYVNFQSADDRVLPDFFEKSMSLLAEYPQAGLCCSDPLLFDSETGRVSQSPLRLSAQPRYFPPDELAEALRRRAVYIPGHTSLIKRSALVEAGGFIPELRWHCDWFALLVIGFRYGICYIPEPLAAMRIHHGSYSASGMKQWPIQREVLSHFLRLLKSPDYCDVLPLFQRSGVLGTFHFRILRLILSSPDHRDYLSAPLIGRVLRYAAATAPFRIASRIAPGPVRQIYRRVRYGQHAHRNIDDWCCGPWKAQ